MTWLAAIAGAAGVVWAVIETLRRRALAADLRARTAELVAEQAARAQAEATRDALASRYADHGARATRADELAALRIAQLEAQIRGLLESLPGDLRARAVRQLLSSAAAATADGDRPAAPAVPAPAPADRRGGPGTGGG